MERTCAVALAIGGLAVGASSAGAATLPGYGYELTVDGSGAFGFNAPRVGLTNTGGVGISALRLALTDLAYNIDAVTDPINSGVDAVDLVSPDTINNGLRTDELDVRFEGFDGGDSWSALMDFDADDFDQPDGSIEDFRQALIDGGEGAVVITVEFEDGTELVAPLPDDLVEGAFGDGATLVMGEESFTVTQDREGAVVIPAPAAALAGLAAMSAWFASRRRWGRG